MSNVVRLLGDGYTMPLDGHDPGADLALEMAEIPTRNGHRHLGSDEAKGLLDSLAEDGWALVYAPAPNMSADA